MARGRKRKQGARRYPGGQLYYDDPRKVVDVQREKAELLRRRDPLYGFPLGVMRVENMLDPDDSTRNMAMFEAGMAYGALAWRWKRIKGFEDSCPRSLSLESQRGLSVAPEPTLKEVEELTAQMDAANAILDRRGNGVRVVLERTLLMDEWPTALRMPELLLGLGALAEQWGKKERAAAA